MNISKYPRSGFKDLTIGTAQIEALAVTAAKIALGTITGAQASASLRAQRAESPIPTVPTTVGTTELLLLAAGAGTLTVARIAFKDALAASDSNFVTFAIVNKTNGNAAMLAATAANTTKVTGGTALSAYTSRSLALNGTGANLIVAAGDVIAVQITATVATALANTLTEGVIKLVFDATA
jgi:hypothetical protein